MDHIGSNITIDAEVETDQEWCAVHIRDSHTNIVAIEKNGERIGESSDAYNGGAGERSFDQGGTDADRVCEDKDIPMIHRYSLRDILSYVNEVPEEEIDFIQDAFAMNMELLEEGLASDRTVITKRLLKENGGKVISEHPLRTAQLLCNGAIEARVLGLSRPAMSITGSGAHGIIVTMPLLAWYRTAGCPGEGPYGLPAREKGAADGSVLLRAAALSFLITMYIKEYSGRLSAFCGCGIAAGTGMACGLAYMRGADEAAAGRVIQNMASGLTGYDLRRRKPRLHDERDRGSGCGVQVCGSGAGRRMYRRDPWNQREDAGGYHEAYGDDRISGNGRDREDDRRDHGAEMI